MVAALDSTQHSKREDLNPNQILEVVYFTEIKWRKKATQFAAWFVMTFWCYVVLWLFILIWMKEFKGPSVLSIIVSVNYTAFFSFFIVFFHMMKQKSYMNMLDRDNQ